MANAIIGGMLEGLGKAGVQAGLQLQQQFGAENLLKMRTEAEKELQASMQRFQTGRDATIEGYASSREIRQDTRADAREVRQDTRADAREVRQETRADTRQGAAFKHAEELAAIHEKAASGRHGATMAAQKAQLNQALKLAEANRPLQQDKDGYYFFKDNNNQINYVYDPTAPEGGRMKGPKDASAVDQIRAKAIIEQIGIIGKDATIDAREKTSAIAALMAALPGAEQSPVVNTKTGYDSATKQVFLNGKSIGEAADGKAAKAMIDAAKGGAPTPTPAPATTDNASKGVVGKEVSGNANLSLMPEWRLNQLVKGGNQRAAAEIERRRSMQDRLIKDLPEE